jgi:hypothetical protein
LGKRFRILRRVAAARQRERVCSVGSWQESGEGILESMYYKCQHSTPKLNLSWRTRHRVQQVLNRSLVFAVAMAIQSFSLRRQMAQEAFLSQ